jgi:membrane protein implicated in regulation of membrane protease activity
MLPGLGVGVFLAGLVLVVVELAYPRRYVGVLGIGLTGAGLVGMLSGRTAIAQPWMVVAFLVLVVLAVPFYRRYAPFVGPPREARVRIGDAVRVMRATGPQLEGLVEAHGIQWSARSDEAMGAGDPARVLGVDGPRLRIGPALGAPAQQDREHEDGRGDRRH